MTPARSILSSRERIRLALNHQTTDRVPIGLVCAGINPPVSGQFDTLLRREKGIESAAYLDGLVDIREVGPAYAGPPLAHGFDIWGVHRKEQSFGSGAYDEIDGLPLAAAQTVGDLDKHPWPDTDVFDYSVLPERIDQIQNARGKKGPLCLMIQNGNIFETSWYMRGFETMFMDFVLNPELVHALFERVTDFYCAHFRKILEAAAGQVDLAFTADDIGGQNGLLTSLGTWEKFIKPYHQRLNRVIHEFGVKVIYHTDGSVMKAVPGLIDMGIDVLQALQFSAKDMDAHLMKEKWGDRLCFEGGVSVQTTLPFGSPEAVREEVRMLIDTLGRDGGYILGPSHWIQAGTPAENVLAMFEEASQYYPF